MSKSRSQQRRTRLFFIPFEKNKAYEELMKQAESVVSQSFVEEPVLPDTVSDRPAAATQPRRPPFARPLTEEQEPDEEEDTNKLVTPPPPEITPPTLVRAVRVKRKLAWDDEPDEQ